LEKEAEQLKEQLKRNRESTADTVLSKSSDNAPAVNVNLRQKRTLKGHLAKIFAMQWAQDSPILASASQDGKLIVWNAVTTLKMNALSLPSNWVMTCGISPTGEFVASGGLDNTCSVWVIKQETPDKVFRELQGHDGFLSCVRFIDNRQLVTSSGDKTCGLWDLEKATQTQSFRGHTGDVMHLSLNSDKRTFVSCSVDKTIMAWDIRSGKSTHLLADHDKDVNVVQFFPNETTFASGSDDSTVRMWDLRCWNEVNRFAYEPNPNSASPTSLGFSQSGRILFASYSENSGVLVGYDTLKGGRVVDMNKAHEKRISSLGVSGDGHALCTASWDCLLKIWV